MLQLRSRLLFVLGLALAVVGSRPALAAAIYQVKDINPGSGTALYDFYVMQDLDGRLFFWAYDGSATVTSGQPWISDGTSAGTQMISAIGSAGAEAVGNIVASAGNVFFAFNDNGTGSALWDSDGTAAGTHRLTQRQTNPCIAPVPRPGGVFFLSPTTANCTDYNNIRLWTSDGTPLGTAVADPTTNVAPGSPYNAADETLFYMGYPGGAYSFVHSDGASDVVNMNLFGTLSALRSVNERMYFAFKDINANSSGMELWSATTRDTSAAITKDIAAGNTDSVPKKLFRVDDRLFFSANDGATGIELWMSDGTELGTQRVLDINAGPPESSPVPLGAIDDVLLFMADDGTHGRELWRSDGTAAGTYLVKDILPDGANGLQSNPLSIVANRHLFFAAYDVGNVPRLWVSDGTATGTHLVDNPGPALLDTAGGSSSNTQRGFAASNGHLFMKANSGNGLELHALDLLQTLGPLSCNNQEQPLKDNGTVQSVMRLPTGTGTTISDLDVRLDLGHTYVGDLKITLTHTDTGTMATLVDRPGGGTCSGALLDIQLDDGAAADADSSCSSGERPAYPRDHTYRPSAPLSVFRGEDIGGKWVLTVEDNATGDSGTLHEWCLHFGDTIFANGFE